jgi:hypothetical protein
MKPAISITMTILGLALATGPVSAQSPAIIQNTRTLMNGVSGNATAASNAALAATDPVPSAAAVTHAAKPSNVAAHATASPMAPKVASKGKHSAAKHSAETKAAVAAPASTAAAAPASGGTETAANEQPVVPDTKYAANGRRDPFISPVVSHAGGSGCSTGKKCLEIGEINLRGVVHAESGFIAVVSNGLNKAYFLRENDPVFNGYVVKITGDSIVFQETLQDRLGKTFTREVVKKITTPAV